MLIRIKNIHNGTCRPRQPKKKFYFREIFKAILKKVKSYFFKVHPLSPYSKKPTFILFCYIKQCCPSIHNILKQNTFSLHRFCPPIHDQVGVHTALSMLSLNSKSCIHFLCNLLFMIFDYNIFIAHPSASPSWLNH